MNIQEKVTNLTDFIHSEINEKKLLIKGEELVNSLRDCWRRSQDEFTDDIVNNLKKIVLQIEAVREFSETMEDFSYFSDKEDVDEAIGALYSIMESLDGLAIVARVHKEIRELLEKKAQLPIRVENERDVAIRKAISRLESKSKPCKKCGSEMVIREGNGSYFWGCSTFPDCWGKSRLTNDELKLIPD